MQDIMPPPGAGAQVIQSYGPDGFRIGNAEYHTHVLVMPTATTEWDGTLSLEALAPILEATPRPEVILIGTGKQHAMVDFTFRAQLRAQGFAVDAMDSGAAARTFNILLTEGRRVAAILMLPV